jgi:glycosyltransferase involved in cell wall biosynthesis
VIAHIVVINDISDAKGGATALALASALAFRERGYRVTFVTGDAGRNERLTDAGIDVVGLGRARLTSSHPAAAFAQGLFNASARSMLSDWIDRHDTSDTVYHLHGWSQILSPSIFWPLRRIRHRLLISAHDFFLVCPNGSYSFLKTGAVCTLTPLSTACVTAQCDRRNYGHKLWRVVRQRIHRTAYQPWASPPVLAIHEAMRPFLVRGGVPDAAVITVPNPIVAYSDHRIPAETNRTALFVGRLEATKGADLAAAACRKAGVTLCLVGDGDMRSALEAQYPDFTFAGRQPTEQITRFAMSARLLLMPSRYPEPYGLVAAEALWSGLPVVAAETAFLTKDIIAAGAGCGVEPRDTQRFAEILTRLFSDDAAIQTMSQNAFAGTRQIGLTPERWIDRLIDLYERRLSDEEVLIA